MQTRSESFIGLDGFSEVVAVASGATSQVFRAYQPAMDRQVAIKVLGLTVHDARVRARFERELATTGHLSRHPLLVTILTHGISATGHPYLVMPWYERGSVADELSRRGTMTVPEVLRIGVKIGAALDHVHGQGVLHRDVKPSNVLLSELGEAVLADFGGAVQLDRMSTATNTFTPNHAAPELFCGGSASAGSDVWSLTSTLYAALTGVPPFALESGSGGLVEELSRLVQEPMPEPSGPDIPAELTDLLRAGLAKQPEDRPSAMELAGELQRIQARLGMPMTEIPGATPWSTAAGRLVPSGAPAASVAATSSGLPEASAGDPQAAAESSVEPDPAGSSAQTELLPIGPVQALSPQVQSAWEMSGESTVLRNPVAPAADRPRLASLRRVGVGVLAGTAAGALVLAGALFVVRPGSASANSNDPSRPVTPVATPSDSGSDSGSDSAGSAPAGSGEQTAGNPVVVGRSATSISLAWRDTNQKRYRYQVIVTPASGSTFAQRADTATAHTVQSLQPGTTYCFRVATGKAQVAPVTAQVCAATVEANN